MKTKNLLATTTAAALAAFSSPVEAIWNTDFNSLTSGLSGSASGVWSEVTDPQTGTGTASGFAVSLITSGEVKAVTDPSQPSLLNGEFPYRNISAGETVRLPDGSIVTTPFAIGLPFAAGTNGDFINIQTEGGAVSTVTIDFGARITDPMLSFSDIDSQTTLAFSSPFTVPASTANLGQSGSSVNNTGPSGDFIFGDEAAGSLQFSGIFTQLTFTVTNASAPGPGNEDRTGYVVTTLVAPEAVPEPATAALLLAATVALAAVLQSGRLRLRC